MNYAAGAVRKVALTTWERIWYVLMCIGFGAGYFAKIPTAKALSELPQIYELSRHQTRVRAAEPTRPDS